MFVRREVSALIFLWCSSRYPEQESYPINLNKGSYYYTEALHKEQYGNDSLAVAVRTPDNKFYAPIPSEFLWTQAPPKQGMEIMIQPTEK